MATFSFATRTREQIRDGYLRDLRLANPNARTEEGSTEWVRATALANQLLPFYANGAYLARQAWPDTGDDATREKFGRTYGIPKLGDKYSRGTITVTGSYAATIASGTILTHRSTGNRYKTVGTSTIDAISLSVVVSVIAMQAGAGSNASVGASLAFDGAPPGVDTNATVISISGGDSAWDSQRWSVEILKRLRQAALAGNSAHILALCMIVQGVEQAFVYPCLRGSGTHDIVITTSQTGGSRVAGTALISQVVGALQVGATAEGGQFLAGIPEDVFRNTRVHAVIAQPVSIRVDYKASAANAWEDWPPYGSGYVVPGTETTWYKVTGAPTNANFRIAKPATGTLVAPTAGKVIGAFFPGSGFCQATLSSVADGGAYWQVTTTGFTDSNGEAPDETIAVGAVIVPWNAMLTNIAGAPASGSQQLSGAVPSYFAALGPGEMTALTFDDETSRRRRPRTSDTNPITGEVEWTTDVTSRLTSALLRATDSPDLSHTVTSGGSTPTVPSGGHIGTPPRVLTLGSLVVIPVPNS